MSVEGNLWYVKLGDGDVERMTLDELDEAFQGGRIDENNMILAAGSDQWMRLSDLLGLADATPPPPPPTPAPFQGTQTARAPMAHVAPPRGMPPLPTTMRAPAGPIPPFAGASSLRPVSFDLGDQIDFSEVQFPRPSRKRWVVGALGTALVLGAGAFFVITRTAGSAPADTTPAAFAAAAALPPPVQATPPTPVTPTPPQPTNAGPSSVMDPTQHLSDEQKQKLLDADKKVKPHQKSHGGGGGGSVSSGSSRSSSKSTTFTTTGSKYDPLNSSL